MNRCPETPKIQDWLDGELEAAEAARFHAHVATCAECAGEVALYRRVFSSLEQIPLLEPRPVLTERILARVLPSQVLRRRRLAVLGWGYAAAVATTVGLLVAGWVQPARQPLLETLSAQASHRLVAAGIFVLNAVGSSVLRLADGWSWLHAIGLRLAPFLRALGAVLAQPTIALTLWAAAVACAVLLWWMRPRTSRAAQEVRHVGVLGF